MSKQKHDYFAPGTFGRTVQDMLSDELMIRLREKLGGREVKFPTGKHGELSEDHWLVQAVGSEDAMKLMDLFGGETFYIPLPLAARDDDKFMNAVNDGLTNRQIAARFSITERHARRRLAKLGVRNPNHRSQSHRLTRMIAAE